MELCTGGSLFNILDDPENTYGLPANEFRLVLEHLSAGMKHLRDNNLVHRVRIQLLIVFVFFFSVFDLQHLFFLFN